MQTSSCTRGVALWAGCFTKWNEPAFGANFGNESGVLRPVTGMVRSFVCGTALALGALLSVACGSSSNGGSGAPSGGTSSAGAPTGGMSNGGASGGTGPSAGASGDTPMGSSGNGGSAGAGAGGAPPCAACDDGRLSLHDGWTLQSSSKVTSTGAEISNAGFATTGWYPVTVPTTVLAGLVANQVYADPYLGDNLSKIPSSIGDGSWWYRTEFTPSADFAANSNWLALDGINYRANVWLNGVQIASSDKTVGTYASFEWKVALKPGVPNALAIQVTAPDLDKDLAISWLDWNPAPPDRDLGIWQDVYLRKSGSVALRGTHVSSKVSAALDSADLTIKADLVNTTAAAVHATITGKLEALTFSQDVDLAANETKTVTFSPTTSPELTLHAPRLWWPAQFGAQELYQLSLSASVSGAESDHEGVQFGVRDVSSSLTAAGYRLFKINGKPILIRGGGWASDMMLRLSAERIETQLQYVRDIGLNTIRLEGKLESDDFLSAADRYGILIIPGWMCCDHWQDWDQWSPTDHSIATASMRTQARRMRNHPSVIDFLIGSDETPPASVENEFLAALKDADWPNPIGASAADRTAATLGKSGMKMPGPYDWVAPGYWLQDDQNGGAFGFNSEAGPGPAVPEIESVKAMLSAEQQTSLWTQLSAEQYHAGTNGSGFNFGTLKLHNDALVKRFGAPTSLEDYVEKAQLMSYEAERAPFEAYSRNKYKSATGYIHWMLNNAWPSLIWHLYGSDLSPAGAYFGAKKGNEAVHVMYSYDDRSLVVVNHTPQAITGLGLAAAVYNLDATQKWSMSQMVDVAADGVTKALVIPAISGLSGTYFVALQLTQNGVLVSSNFYFLSSKVEQINFGATDWYHSPTSTYADYTALATLPKVALQATLAAAQSGAAGTATVTLKNSSTSIAFFTRLKLTAGKQGKAVLPVIWQDNYVSLLPGETRTLAASYALGDLGGAAPVVEVTGFNQGLQVVGG